MSLHEFSNPAYLCFVDLKKANDWVLKGVLRELL